MKRISRRVRRWWLFAWMVIVVMRNGRELTDVPQVVIRLVSMLNPIDFDNSRARRVIWMVRSERFRRAHSTAA